MSITRIGQLTAETQFETEFVTDGAFAATISTTKVKTGAYSYRHQINTDPMGLGFANKSMIRAGFWVNHIGTTSFDASLFRWHHSDGDEAHIYWDNNTNNLVYLVEGDERDSVGVAAANFNRNDEWIHVGLVVKSGADGFVSLYIDGIRVINYEGVIEGNIDALYMGGKAGLSGWNSSAYFDDFYVDELSAEVDAAPPSKRFMYARPNAAGADSEWTPIGDTPNFECVDDTGVPDDETTYVKALEAGLLDTYNVESITLPVDHVIRAVIPIAIARKTDSGTDATLKLHSYDGATYQSSAAKTLSVSYGSVWERQPLQPDGSAWNEADFAAMQFGIESAGAF